MACSLTITTQGAWKGILFIWGHSASSFCLAAHGLLQSSSSGYFCVSGQRPHWKVWLTATGRTFWLQDKEISLDRSVCAHRIRLFCLSNLLFQLFRAYLYFQWWHLISSRIFMRRSKTGLVSQPPTIRRMFEILGPVLRTVSLTKVTWFQWRKNFHIPNKEFWCAVAEEFMFIVALGVVILAFHTVGAFDAVMSKRCGTIWEILKANVDHVKILHFYSICQCLSWNRFVHDSNPQISARLNLWALRQRTCLTVLPPSLGPLFDFSRKCLLPVDSLSRNLTLVESETMFSSILESLIGKRYIWSHCVEVRSSLK